MDPYFVHRAHIKDSDTFLPKARKKKSFHGKIAIKTFVRPQRRTMCLKHCIDRDTHLLIRKVGLNSSFPGSQSQLSFIRSRPLCQQPTTDLRTAVAHGDEWSVQVFINGNVFSFFKLCHCTEWIMRWEVVTIPGNWGSDGTLPVLLHNDSILWQLFLDQNDFLLTFYNEITPCKEIPHRANKSPIQNQTVLIIVRMCYCSRSASSFVYLDPEDIHWV